MGKIILGILMMICGLGLILVGLKILWSWRKRIKIYSKSEAAFREAQTDITPGKNKGLINPIFKEGRGNWGK